MTNFTTVNFRKLLTIPYFVLIIVGLVLPSDGNHGLFSIKSLAFIGCSLAILLHLFIAKKMNLLQFKLLTFLLCSLCFLLACFLYSNWYGKTEMAMIIDQAKSVWITLFVAGVSLYLFEEKSLTFSTFLKTIVYSNFFFSSGKVVLMALHMLNVVNAWQLLEKFGMRFMSMGMGSEGLTRMQTSVDIITPFLIFFVLSSDNLGVSFSRLFKVAFCFISILAIILSFSRVVIFVACLAFGLYWLTLNLSKFTKNWIIAFIVAIGVTCLTGPGVWVKMIERRFFSSSSEHSDSIREQQIDALLIEFSKNPLFGKGMGSYAENVIRDERLKYSYEVQWVALLMQFGLVGLFLFLIPLGSIFSRFLRKPFDRFQMSFIVLFICWLLAGFTNPFLLSLTSGIIYSLFLLSGQCFHKINTKLYQTQ